MLEQVGCCPNLSLVMHVELFRKCCLLHMGGCQNYGPFLGTLNIRCRIIIGIQKRTHYFDNHPYNPILNPI